ncbi:hypothetical protein SAMN05519226_1487 [Cycloclasticus pugetii]|nr:hypothetical protein SAMN05519226_1487 [Cycloclasticus pugetii]
MTNITIDCNSAALTGYLALLEHVVDLGKLTLDLGNLGFELARVDVDNSATSTGKLLVTLYPSDSLLSFVATALAGDADA